jgi:hypothetical protein
VFEGGSCCDVACREELRLVLITGAVYFVMVIMGIHLYCVMPDRAGSMKCLLNTKRRKLAVRRAEYPVIRRIGEAALNEGVDQRGQLVCAGEDLVAAAPLGQWPQPIAGVAATAAEYCRRGGALATSLRQRRQQFLSATRHPQQQEAADEEM